MHKYIHTFTSTILRPSWPAPSIWMLLCLCLQGTSIHAASPDGIGIDGIGIDGISIDETSADLEPTAAPTPNTPNINFNPAQALSNCFASLNTSVVVLAACERALLETAEYSAQKAQAHSALAMLYAQRNNLAAARTEMDAALAITAEDPIVQGNLGNLLIREGNYNGAIEIYSQLLFTTPEQAALYLNRSLALRAIGRYDEAAKDYAAYLNLYKQVSPVQPEFERSFESTQTQSNPST